MINPPMDEADGLNKKQVMTMKMHRHGGGPSDDDKKKKKGSIELKKMKEEVIKVAAMAMGLNVRLRSADMAVPMQERAFRHARALLHSAAAHRRPNPTLLARSLKQEFDSVYGPAWHCVVGTSFGSFVTHSPSGFIYFSVDSLSFLLFKTQVHLIAQP